MTARAHRVGRHNAGVTRIVAGAHRGRPLVVPAGGTRPTADRAREGLFSTLTSLLGLDGLEGAAVLDLYAGSGALGLEAFSRGAATVTFVDDSPRAIKAIRANVATLKVAGARVVESSARAFLAGAGGTTDQGGYDVALLDPPYDMEVDDVLVALGQVLAVDAVVAVERSSRAGPLVWPAGISAVRSRRYGEATLWYGARP